MIQYPNRLGNRILYRSLIFQQVIFRVALTLIIIYRAEIVETEDITQLSQVFKRMVAGDLVNDCHEFMKRVFLTAPKSLTRANIERLRQSVGVSGLD